MAMHNVLAIFRHDIGALARNVIAAIVAVGLMIVPPMYAWLTTLGFWDPYSNTGNIKVAVADEDAGYTSSLIPTKVDAGSSIESALHENKQFDWIFVDEDQAVDGVKSGEYYAAIVIPSNFSHDLMTVFSDKATRAKIYYYSNEKENAIAPRVTDAGATALQNQIDETFTKTVANIALSLTTGLADFMDGESIANYATLLISQIDTVLDDMDNGAEQLEGLSSTIGTTGHLIETGSQILGNADEANSTADALMDETAQALENAASALDGASGQINAGVSDATQGYDSVSAAVDSALDSASQDPAAAVKVIDDAMGDVSTAISLLQDLRQQVPETSSSQVSGAFDAAASSLESLLHSLEQARSDIQSAASDAQASKADIDSRISEARQKMGTLTEGLESSLKQQAEELSSDLSAIKGDSSELDGQITELAKTLSETGDSLAGSLEEMKQSLDSTAAALRESSEDILQSRNAMEDALSSGDLEKVRTIIGSNPDAIASFLAAPTLLEKHAVYKMNSNGSSMSAFYTSLCLWIGAIFLVALTNVNPSKKLLATLDNPKPWQVYLGRYGVFALIAAMQGVIVCIGNVFFVGVQCEHFWLYLLACVFCGIVFSNFVYTLTTSFGNVGKAIAIVLLVMQLAGSGGIFPIQMSAPIFQEIYPWLSFAHSMEAFQGCIAGIYGMQYWQSLGLLGLFLAGSLVVGMALRRPLMRMNGFIAQKLDETQLL